MKNTEKVLTFLYINRNSSEMAFHFFVAGVKRTFKVTYIQEARIYEKSNTAKTFNCLEWEFIYQKENWELTC